jgi:aminopeptidase N
MSANTTAEEPFDDTHTKYSFNCTIRIPTYLIAIVVGDLEERFLNDRVSVIAEPVDLDAAAKELEDMPKILEVVETYLQLPYIWAKYSIVIMPPSFPWGGMVSYRVHQLRVGGGLTSSDCVAKHCRCRSILW